MPDAHEQGKISLGEELICPLHPVYYGVRTDIEPREPHIPEGHRLWLVSRYNDVRAVLADSRMVKDVAGGAALYNRQTGGNRPVIGGPIAGHILNLDPPDHTRLRGLVSKAFTEESVGKFRVNIEQNAAALLDKLQGQEKIDLIRAFALPLAVTNTVQLLGLPVNQIQILNSWAESLTEFLLPDEANVAAAGIVKQLETLIANKRESLGEDLLSVVIAAHDDGGMTDDELIAMSYVLIVAGFETSVNLIANVVLALLQHPEQLARLRADAALMPGAIEEVLRYDGPASTSSLRFTTAPVQVGGVEIPAGEFVLASLRAANRDESRFPDPNAFDITRPAFPHMSFGHGIHFCIGAILGRVEAGIAVGMLLDRFPDLALGVPDEELTWLDGTIVHNLASLPVSLVG